jgi:putative redox protein
LETLTQSDQEQTLFLREREKTSMKLQCTWQEKMRFSAQADGHQIEMDALAPIGSDSALTPKQLVVAGVCGCTAMDVVALLKKYKQPLDSFSVEAEATMTDGSYPVVFKEIRLIFKLEGTLDAAKVLEAITLSQTKFCAVSAMLSKAVPILYSVELNGRNIGEGHADFK